MDLTKKITRYLFLWIEAGISDSNYTKMKCVLTTYAKENKDISSQRIEEYLKARYNPRVSTYRQYKRVLDGFLYFCSTGEVKRLAGKKKAEVTPLLIEEVARRESYVDEDGILRVQYSKVPAPNAWISALCGKVPFNLKKTRKERLEHTIREKKGNPIILT